MQPATQRARRVALFASSFLPCSQTFIHDEIRARRGAWSRSGA